MTSIDYNVLPKNNKFLEKIRNKSNKNIKKNIITKYHELDFLKNRLCIDSFQTDSIKKKINSSQYSMI